MGRKMVEIGEMKGILDPVRVNRRKRMKRLIWDATKHLIWDAVSGTSVATSRQRWDVDTIDGTGEMIIGGHEAQECIYEVEIRRRL